MRKSILLAAALGLFFSAGAANACDGHKTSVKKASVQTEKKECSAEAKKACETKATKASMSGGKSCCASKAEGVKADASGATAPAEASIVPTKVSKN